MTLLAPPRLQVRTRLLGDADGGEALAAPLPDLLPGGTDPRDVVSWVREGDGLIGWGRAAQIDTEGPDRFGQAQEWWQGLVADADVDDEVGLPGTGPVAFGSFSFSPASPAGGTLVVPRVLVGRREGRSWLTTIGTAGPGAFSSLVVRQDRPPPPAVRLHDGAVPAARWPDVVCAAIHRITRGDVDKVVLARDVLAVAAGPLDVATLLGRLADRYSATWTFAVDGLLGATPEMLVRLQDGTVRSRVLAGTLRRDVSPGPSVTETHPDLATPHSTDPRLRLISSDKDLEEHGFAVRSVAEALAPHCTDLVVPTEPFVLELPDVYHLASDLSATPGPGATSLRLAAALHPSAAVCGTPLDAAARVIEELEGMDRGRYAGPVGWLDARGDGDWGIALRCGQVADDGRSVRLFAGGGIVAASDPEAELAETEAKLSAMRHALLA